MKQSGQVRAKKHLGQHFLNSENIANHIVKSLVEKCHTPHVLEIGPGMGVLTQLLLDQSQFETHAIDIDKESIVYLNEKFPNLTPRLHEGDFLHMKLSDIVTPPFSIIGNFPYNISSQIIFKIIECRDEVPLMVGMFQKEVAERLTAKPRSKAYGILSVLTEAFYDVEYLFTVDEHVFTPPPKVKSAVIRMVRKPEEPEVSQKALFHVVKVAFNQRRKKLRNALQSFGINDEILQQEGCIDKRAEELSLKEFISLTKLIMTHGKTVN